MTEEQYLQAKELRNRIWHYEELLAILNNEHNNFQLPEEIWNRHISECRTYLENELKRVSEAFTAL